jgi:hypothetical protein
VSALPELTGNLTINGNGTTIMRADAAPIARIFAIGSTGNLTLNSVIVQGGMAPGTAGGGIANIGGHLTLTNSQIINNGAIGGFGGGVGSTGTVSIQNSTIRNNSASFGGGLANLGGSMTIDSSTIYINSSDVGPAEIYNSGPLLGDGTLTLVNSTVVGNETGTSDIGILKVGTFNTYNSTIAFNESGGINNQGGTAESPSITTLVNTIVAKNGTAGCDASQTSVGGIVDGGHNLDSGDTCGFSAANHSLSNTDPGFSPAGLSFQGGPTQVVPLKATSPAVDAGDDTTCQGDLVNSIDQRGVARPQGAHCDFGAFEVLTPVVTANLATAQDVDTAVQLSASATFDCGDTFTDCPTEVSGTITFSVTDSENNAVGTAVSGTISSGSASAQFNPYGLAPGAYTITATYHDTSNTYADSSATSTLTITAGPAASITLTPGDTSSTVGQMVTETITVLDGAGYPVEDGTVVQYTVTGSNPLSGTRSTFNGQATISYSGAFTGTDSLTVTAQGGTNPQATATITWNAPASTPRSSLTIMSFFGSRVQAIVSVDPAGQPGGTFSYADRSIRLSNVQLARLVVNGSNATLYGTANLADGTGVSFRLDVSASRVGGTLRLQLSNGYDSGRFSAPVVRVRP